jgi:protein required for attachment to host cells
MMARSRGLPGAAGQSPTASVAGAAAGPAARARSISMGGDQDAPGEDWLLVAGATEARLLRRNAEGGLEALQTFHEVRDRAQEPHAGTGRRRIGEPSQQRRRQLRFAAALAAQLDHGVAEGRCRRICLLAACPFMGALRQCLPSRVRRAVQVTILADLCHASDQRILDAVADATGTDDRA